MLSRTALRRFVVPESSLVRVALSAAFIYVAVAACVWVASDRMIFLPPAPGYRATPDVLRLATAGGERIAALYWLNSSATYTMLFSHGNAEDLGSVRPLLPALGDLGFSVFAYDYQIGRAHV